MRFAIDTGGTFTDLAVEDETGRLHQFKSPTTPDDPVRGLLDVLQHSSGALRHDSGGAPRTRRDAHPRHHSRHQRCGHRHGGTDGVPHHVGAAARSSSTARAARRSRSTRSRSSRSRTCRAPSPSRSPNGSRTTGGSCVRWTRPATRRSSCGLRDRQVEAVGVCLLFVDDQSRRTSCASARYWPSSCRRCPSRCRTGSTRSLREYRRASSTVDRCLAQAGDEPATFAASRPDSARPASVAGSSSPRPTAACSTPQKSRRLRSMPSIPVPAMAPDRRPRYRRRRRPGTPRSSSPIPAARPTTSASSSAGASRRPRETWIGPRYVGHMTGFPSVDVRSVGAGGGSIAWVDTRRPPPRGPAERRRRPGPGLLRPRRDTSPRSPTPAWCWAISTPRYFLGGAMKLEVDAARRGHEGLGWPTRPERGGGGPCGRAGRHREHGAGDRGRSRSSRASTPSAPCSSAAAARPA